MSFYDSKQSEYSFQKPYSEATAEKIDKEVKQIIDEAYERTKGLLTQHREHLGYDRERTTGEGNSFPG